MSDRKLIDLADRIKGMPIGDKLKFAAELFEHAERDADKSKIKTASIVAELACRELVSIEFLMTKAEADDA